MSRSKWQHSAKTVSSNLGVVNALGSRRKEVTKETLVHQTESVVGDWQWSVSDFLLLPKEPRDAWRESPVFVMAGSGGHGEVRWQFRVFPGGDDDGVGADYRRVSLEIILERSPTSLVIVTGARVCIVDGRGREAYVTEESDVRRQLQHGHRMAFDLIRRATLDKQRDRLLPANVLTVRCRLTITNVLTDITGFSVLADCLGKLFADQRDGDVIIKVKDGAEFRAHKSIICSRSLVFHRKFRMDKTRKVIRIENIDEDVAWEMLYYLYTDRAPKVASMLPELKEAGRLYDLPGLVHLCETYTRENVITPSGFPDSGGCRKMRKCEICVRERRVISVSDLNGTRIFPIDANISHSATNVVYAVYCVRCRRYVYVGATQKLAKKAIKEDVGEIKKGKKQLGIHFSSKGHSGKEDCEVTLIEVISKGSMGKWSDYIPYPANVTERDRLLRKTFWAVKMQTRVIDGGANEILHYD